MYALRKGLGIAGPGNSALNVANWGSYLSASFCNSFPVLCTNAAIQASRGYLYPQDVYAQPSPPPAPPAPSNLVTPGSEYEGGGIDAGLAAQFAVDDTIAAASAQEKANALMTMNQTYQNIQNTTSGDGSNPVTTGFPTWGWWVIGAAAFALFFQPATRGRR